MNRSQTMTNTSPYKTLVVSLILPFVLLLTGAKWAETPVENLGTIAGEWEGKGMTGTGLSFEVGYVFRKDGSYDSRVRGGSLLSDWSTQSDMPPGTLQLKGGKLEYQNKKGLVRTGVLYEDAKGRRVLMFQTESGTYWRVREKKE